MFITDPDKHYAQAEKIDIRIEGKGEFFLLETVFKNVLSSIHFKHVESNLDGDNAVIYTFKPSHKRKRKNAK